MKIRPFLTVACFLASLTPSAAEVAVASGSRVKLDSVGAFDQACHSLGPMTANILQQPQGGAVSIERVLDYPNFPSFNTRSRCNASRLPETRLFYQSSAGFVGNDVVMIEWIGPGGGVRRNLYRISVRPGVVVAPEVSEAPSARRRHTHHARAYAVRPEADHRAHRPQGSRHPKASPTNPLLIPT